MVAALRGRRRQTAGVVVGASPPPSACDPPAISGAVVVVPAPVMIVAAPARVGARAGRSGAAILGVAPIAVPARLRGGLRATSLRCRCGRRARTGGRRRRRRSYRPCRGADGGRGDSRSRHRGGRDRSDLRRLSRGGTIPLRPPLAPLASRQPQPRRPRCCDAEPSRGARRRPRCDSSSRPRTARRAPGRPSSIAAAERWWVRCVLRIACPATPAVRSAAATTAAVFASSGAAAALAVRTATIPPPPDANPGSESASRSADDRDGHARSGDCLGRSQRPADAAAHRATQQMDLSGPIQRTRFERGARGGASGCRLEPADGEHQAAPRAPGEAVDVAGRHPQGQGDLARSPGRATREARTPRAPAREVRGGYVARCASRLAPRRSARRRRARARRRCRRATRRAGSFAVWRSRPMHSLRAIRRTQARGSSTAVPPASAEWTARNVAWVASSASSRRPSRCQANRNTVRPWRLYSTSVARPGSRGKRAARPAPGRTGDGAGA